MRKKGYILIVTTIIIALIISGLLYATSIWLRTHATESTEIAQREIALYAAQYGINEMIYNLNTGTTYTNGQSISDTTPSGYSYNATYYNTGDTFDGTAYIKGVGTAGSFKRTIYASITGGSSEAFKYCLFSSTGGSDNSGSDTYFSNSVYGSPYFYNKTTATIPTPDSSFYLDPYNPEFDLVLPDQSGANNNYTFSVSPSHLNKLVFVYFRNTTRTLTINFNSINSANFSISIVTNARNVTIQNINPPGKTWSGVIKNGVTYPLLVHTGTGLVNIQLTKSYLQDYWITFQGFFYSAGSISVTYDYTCYGRFVGEVIVNNPSGNPNGIGGNYGDTRFVYSYDYFRNPPPHFGSASGFTYLTGSYREEY